MSIKARRGLLLVTITVVVVGALLLNVGVSSPTEAQSLETPQSSAIPKASTAEATTTQAAADGANGLIAFESNQVTHNPERDYEIFTMNPDGTGLTNLTNNDINKPDQMPAWSADGRHIAFICSGNGGNAEICKMDADGSNQVQVTNDPNSSYCYPTWSPDGTKIAYSDCGSTGNIYVVKADGTGQRLLASNGGLPDWSPVNNQIVFVSHRDFNNEIYKMNADGSGQTRLTNAGQGQTDTAPAWSPDGKQIVFQSNGDLSAVGGAFEIYKMNADGSGETHLTQNPWPPFITSEIFDFAPDWSPDGSQIVFQANRTPSNGQFLNDEIFVMNADGSEQRNLTNQTGDFGRDRNPDWQPLDTTDPGPVEGFAATAENDRVSLSWTNPTDADFAATRILRSTSGFASGPEPTEDQIQVYEGTATSHADEGLTNDTTYHYTAFARDNAGNWSTAATASATIGPPPDITSPVLSLPNDMSVEATGAAGAEVTYNATATDLVDGSVNVNCEPASGSTFPLGDTTVNCSAQDAAGNDAIGSFMVTVEDTTAPSLTVPRDTIVVEATSSAGAVVNYENPTASDLVDGNNVAVKCEPPSGSTFPLGTTRVNCSAQDAAGNTATGSFTVKVQDTTAPELTVPSNTIVVEATDASGITVNFADDVSASDAVDPNPSIACTPASGSTFEPGTTTVSCTAKDATGNESATKSFEVSVTYDMVSPCNIGEIEPPVNNVSSVTDQGMSAYKYGSRGVIPAKFRAVCNGDPSDTQAEADAHPMKLKLTKLGATPDQDAVVENTLTGSANTGDLFRFDDAADQYIYNIGVKNLAKGIYKITISEANGGATHDEWFSIK